MTLAQFKQKYLGRHVDYDGFYGSQCVDLIQFYARDVVGSPRFTGNAVDIIRQNPGNKYLRVGSPQAGDIVVFPATADNGYAGHVAIMLNSKDSLDQNYPTGSKVAVRRHSERPLGYLRPKRLQSGGIMLKLKDLLTQRARLLRTVSNLRKIQQRTNFALAGQTYLRLTGKLGTDKQRRRFVDYVHPDKVVKAIESEVKK